VAILRFFSPLMLGKCLSAIYSEHKLRSDVVNAGLCLVSGLTRDSGAVWSFLNKACTAQGAAKSIS